MIGKKILMLTGSLSEKVSGGMGVAATSIANELEKLTHLQLIASETSDNLSIKNVFQINTETEFHKETTTSIYPKTTIDYTEFDYLVSPYNSIKQTSTTNNLSLTEIKNETLSPIDQDYLSGIALYNRKIVELASTMVFDIIYCHDWVTFQAGIALKLLTGKKLVVHIHSLETDRNPNSINHTIYTLERKAMDYANLVIAVSNYSKERIKKNYEIYPEKIRIVHNAYTKISTTKKIAAKDQYYVLFLGRLASQKGAGNFISIAENVSKKIKNVQFIIAGEGDLKNEIESQIVNSTISNNIQLLGFVNKDEQVALLNMVDVYCMPSISEPYGMTALEVASAEIPCVISKQSGVSEILTSSLKSDSDDLLGFSQNICLILENENLKKTIITGQTKDISGLNWTSATLEIFKNIERIN